MLKPTVSFSHPGTRRALKCYSRAMAHFAEGTAANIPGHTDNIPGHTNSILSVWQRCALKCVLRQLLTYSEQDWDPATIQPANPRLGGGRLSLGSTCVETRHHHARSQQRGHEVRTSVYCSDCKPNSVSTLFLLCVTSGGVYFFSSLFSIPWLWPRPPCACPRGRASVWDSTFRKALVCSRGPSLENTFVNK